RRHTRFSRDWSSDVCSSDLVSNSEAIEYPLQAMIDIGLQHEYQRAAFQEPGVQFLGSCFFEWPLRARHNNEVAALVSICALRRQHSTHFVSQRQECVSGHSHAMAFVQFDACDYVVIFSVVFVVI